MRVLIADDDQDMRLLTKVLLEGDPRLAVVAQAEDGVEAVTAFRQVRPDVCVLDHRMPGLTGAEAARMILAEDPDARVVIFSAFMTDAEQAEALAELRIAFLRKDYFTKLPDLLVELAG